MKRLCVNTTHSNSDRSDRLGGTLCQVGQLLGRGDFMGGTQLGRETRTRPGPERNQVILYPPSLRCSGGFTTGFSRRRKWKLV